MKTTNQLRRVMTMGILLLSPSALVAATTYNVSTAAQLASAVASANSIGGDANIVLADGTYTLSATLQVTAPLITIKSLSGNRANVTIQGDAMSANAVVKNVIRVSGSNFTIQDLTIRRAGWHCIQIAGESNADSPTIRNVILRDSYEQMLKGSTGTSGVHSDNGLVENCLFEYSAGIGPQYYIGGIDLHGGANWIVRGNTFKNIISPNTAIAEHAIHFWDGSSNTLVEKNTIINCDRGIGFGLHDRGNTGGIIRNNMIYHAANAGTFADVSISLENSPNTKVHNNTIYMANSYPSAIEYRFPGTTNVSITNNLTNKAVTLRDNASGTDANNIKNAASTWFVNVSQGDLHLASNSLPPVNAGQAISGFGDDFDSQPRPQGSANEIGADELPVSGPEAKVLGNTIEILDGDTTPGAADRTDFGSVDASSGSVTNTYTIQNTGTAPLTVSNVTVSNAVDFAVLTQPATSLAAGNSTTFSVKFDPAVTGVRTASLSFSNSDANENPYDFTIRGTGGAPVITSIGVNLADTANALAPGDIVGVIPAGNWNNATRNNETLTDAKNSSGIATTADITLGGGAYFYANSTGTYPSPMADDAKMMKTQRGMSNSGSMSIVAKQVPYATYDVYVYWGGRTPTETVPATMTIHFQADNAGTWTTTQTKFIKDADHRWDGTYNESPATSATTAIDGEEYVVFRNITTPTFKLLATTGVRTGICGIQIVQK